MKFTWTVFVLILHGTVVLIGQATPAGDPQADAIQHLLEVGPDAAGTDKAQNAVDTLVAVGPKALPAILAIIPADDVVKANWLRVAFNRIVDAAVREKKILPINDLLLVVNHKKKPGRSRRLAREVVEKVTPGATAKVIDAGLDDPEFSADAVAAWMIKAASIEKTDPATAVQLYREAFDAARDFKQCLALAQRLKALDVVVDPLARLCVIRDWMVIGPFDDPDEKGYATVFPPEKMIDPNSTFVGKNGMVVWKRFTSETPDGRIDLLQAIGRNDSAVAYAYVVVNSPKDQEVELRGSGDDNLAVWVNGTKVIDHPTYRSHLRIDWHRAKVKLKAGENTILVKVCQCPAPKEKAAYVAVNPKARGFKTTQTPAQWQNQGKWYLEGLGSNRLSGKAVMKGVMIVSAIGGWLVYDTPKAMACTAESQHFKNAIKSLSEGDLPRAERDLFGEGNAWGSNCFYQELADKVDPKYGILFHEAFYAKLKEINQRCDSPFI